MSRYYFIPLLLILYTFNVEASDLDSSFEEKAFNKINWKKGSLRIRGEMVENLITQQNLLLGLKKNEVISLLGTPNKKLNNVLYYYVDLGIEENSQLIIFTMRIFFNEDLKVAEVVELAKLNRTVRVD